jgi:hypothetical protein
MKVIWERLIDVLPLVRRNERRDNKVDVGEEEKDCDWEGSTEGRFPFLRAAVGGEGAKIEVDESTSDKHVYYCQRIGDDAEERHMSEMFMVRMGKTHFRMKLYASPGGGASIVITDTSQCSKRPMNGALKGLLLAQRRDQGRIPSRPIS